MSVVNNYQIIAPTLITDFSSTTGMALTQGTGSVALDSTSTYVRTGTKSLKIVQQASASSALVDLDMRNAAFGGNGSTGPTYSTKNLWHLRCFIDTPANQNNLSFFVSNGTTFVNYFAAAKMGPQISTSFTDHWWDRPENRKDWATGGGSPSWTSDIKTIRIRPNANANGAFTTWLDALYVGGYARPKILITFDDSNDTQYDYAKPILDEYGIKGTFYIIGGPMSAGTAGSMTTAQANELYEDGHDIAFHAWLNTYDNYSQLTSAELVGEMDNFQSFIESNGWTRARYHLAYPQGNNSATIRAIVSGEGFVTARGTTRLLQSHILGLDNAHHLRAYSWGAADGTAGPIAWMNDAVAYGSTIFIAFHIHDPDTSTGQQISDADFETVIRHAHKLQQSNLADVVTVSQWYNGLTASTSRRPR